MEQENENAAEFKTKIVLELIREDASINEIAARYNIDSVLLGHWKNEFLKHALEDFFKNDSSNTKKELKKAHQRVLELEIKISQLNYEINWLRRNEK